MLKALIVDDNESQCLLLGHYLKGLCSCDAVQDGASAVVLFRQALRQGEPYALLLMDLDLPYLNGYQAMRHMRALEDEHGYFPPHVCRFIVVSSLGSAFTVSADSDGCLVDTYFTKPLSQADLLRKVKALSVLYGPPSADPGSSGPL